MDDPDKVITESFLYAKECVDALGKLVQDERILSALLIIAVRAAKIGNVPFPIVHQCLRSIWEYDDILAGKRPPDPTIH